MTDAQTIEKIKHADIERLSTEIPGYWNAHLAEKIEKIHQRQIEAGISGTSFALLADFHCGVNCLHSPAIMKKVLTECSIPYFYNSGDFVSGMGIVTPEDLIREIVVSRLLFSQIEEKHLMTVGNHEPAYSTFPPPAYYAEYLSKEAIYEYVFRPQTAYKNRVFGESGMYFYADDTFHKVRHIVLNSHDLPSDEQLEKGGVKCDKFRLSGFQNEQLNWFAKVALDVPSQDWTVVLCTHEPMSGNLEMKIYNVELLLGIINAFRKHTAYQAKCRYEDICGFDAELDVDYTGKGGDFAVWVGGHVHKDDCELRDGVLSVCTRNDCLMGADRTANTVTEQAFDVFTIDKNAHKLYVTRIGAGEDREFTYDVWR